MAMRWATRVSLHRQGCAAQVWARIQPQSRSQSQSQSGPTSRVKDSSAEKTSHKPPAPRGDDGADSEDFVARLREKMLSRGGRRTLDCMTPAPALLLDLALQKHLPPNVARTGSGGGLVTGTGATYLPQGFHLAYFPPHTTEDELLPDGTDTAHWPGEPYTRRLWAGGSMVFNEILKLTGRAFFCTEKVQDVRLRNGNVHVTISRDYEYTDRPRGPPVEETRTLVFLKKDSQGQESQPAPSVPKKKQATAEPDYSFEMTPTRHLLSRFSALTYNAHRIHLDREYCREVEGHRDLLVHGPLTVVLMLAALRSQLPLMEGAKEDERDEGLWGHQMTSFVEFLHTIVDGATFYGVRTKMVKDWNRGAWRPTHTIHRIDYRNLTPLYVDEPLRVCVRHVGIRPDDDPDKKHLSHVWDLWIETVADKTMAVKAQAVTWDWDWKREESVADKVENKVDDKVDGKVADKVADKVAGSRSGDIDPYCGDLVPSITSTTK